ncbi:pre-mRNA-splicing factor SPF27 [Hyalella azteca]|uniref:Pre-mRNA-splicing factor SPF27 n=1 Tax=Hyalella azteca TaxID=294128 RepID=A0A8B7NML0_HYAAZ|nr:pre-mRNA-splicing factor SPF27 [Hyalella azteca]
MASQEVIVDALPYIDTGYDEPGVREAAIAMVEDEKKRYRPTKNYLEHLPPLNLSAFETEIMRNEFERLSVRQPMDTLSMKRYELPPPPPGKMTDVSAWSECVDNSFAQLEHQATRLMNLELLGENGSEAWKSHNEELQRMLSRTQAQLADLKKAVQEVNWARKSLQCKAGEELRHLESTWVSLVSRNYDIEQACVNLQQQLQRYSELLEAKRDNHDNNNASDQEM